MERSLANKAWLRRVGRQSQLRLQGLFAFEMPVWAYFLDFVLYPPAILLCLFVGFSGEGAGQALESLAMVLAGACVWTLAEYLIHRFAFHHAPLIKSLHLAHHAAPRDLNGSPTLLTVAVFFLTVYLPLRAVMGGQLAAAGMAGVLTGYLAYVLVHHLVHHGGSRGFRPLRRLIRLHAVHHHDPKHNFGVTSDFWDRVFGTRAPR